jgi:hypothetical protein
MTQKTFSAQIDDWVRSTKERVEAVFHMAAQDVAEEIQGIILAEKLIDTGFYRASLEASGTQMPVMRAEAKPATGVTYSYDAGPINLIIQNIPLGGTVYLGFSAIYARRLEYGFVGEDSLGRAYNQSGYRVVGRAAQNWGWIVAEAVSRAKAAVLANERRDRSL